MLVSLSITQIAPCRCVLETVVAECLSGEKGDEAIFFVRSRTCSKTS